MAVKCIERVKNLVNETHKKTAHHLCSHFDTILLPSFETQNMVQKHSKNGKTRTIRSKTARSLLTWSHYKFKDFLKSKVLMTGSELVEVNEAYTTKCCGMCGQLNDVGSSATFKCKYCDFNFGRDENAARNIFSSMSLLEISYWLAITKAVQC